MKKKLKSIECELIELKGKDVTSFMDGFTFGHVYFEIVDKDGKVAFITGDEFTAISMANRYNLNWRAVSGEFKYVKEEDDTKESNLKFKQYTETSVFEYIHDIRSDLSLIKTIKDFEDELPYFYGLLEEIKKWCKKHETKESEVKE